MSAGALSDLVAELPEELRRQALTHSSWTEERTDSYERLAYLGDSVLALAVARVGASLLPPKTGVAWPRTAS